MTLPWKWKPKNYKKRIGLEFDRSSSKKTRSRVNKNVVRVVEEMKKVEVKILREDEWQIERELVLKKEKVYILKNEELRVEVI